MQDNKLTRIPTNDQTEAEFKEFEPRLKFKPRLKYGWSTLNCI